MGKWPNFEYHVGKWLKYDRSGYNSSHPSLGSLLDLGNPWRPFATLGDPAWKWPIWGKLVIFKHVVSSNPIAWVVKRTKLNSKKGVLGDTLIYITPRMQRTKDEVHKNAAHQRCSSPKMKCTRDAAYLRFSIPKILHTKDASHQRYNALKTHQRCSAPKNHLTKDA